MIKHVLGNNFLDLRRFGWSMHQRAKSLRRRLIHRSKYLTAVKIKLPAKITNVIEPHYPTKGWNGGSVALVIVLRYCKGPNWSFVMYGWGPRSRRKIANGIPMRGGIVLLQILVMWTLCMMFPTARTTDRLAKNRIAHQCSVLSRLDWSYSVLQRSEATSPISRSWIVVVQVGRYGSRGLCHGSGG